MIKDDMVESSKAYYILFNKWRTNDLYKSVFASFGLIVAIINFEHDTHLYKKVIDIEKFPNAMVHPRNTNYCNIVLKMLIFTTTFISLIFTF